MSPGDVHAALVDTTRYGLPGPHWCALAEHAPTAERPWRLALPAGAAAPRGEYAADELLSTR